VAGELVKLGHQIAASTVWQILHDAGIDPVRAENRIHGSDQQSCSPEDTEAEVLVPDGTWTWCRHRPAPRPVRGWCVEIRWYASSAVGGRKAGTYSTRPGSGARPLAQLLHLCGPANCRIASDLATYLHARAHGTRMPRPPGIPDSVQNRRHDGRRPRVFEQAGCEGTPCVQLACCSDHSHGRPGPDWPALSSTACPRGKTRPRPL
jgi:hypothetical protein